MTTVEIYKLNLEELQNLYKEEMQTLEDKILSWQHLELVKRLIIEKGGYLPV